MPALVSDSGHGTAGCRVAKKHAVSDRGRVRTRWIIEKYLRRGLRCSCGHTAEETAPGRGDFGPGVAPYTEHLEDGRAGDLLAACPRCTGLMSGFSPDKEAGRAPDAVEVVERNVLLNEGIAELWDLGITTGATKYDNSNAQLGVGNSNTAADATQTDLQGGSTAWASMAVTYPSRAAQVVSWQSEYGSGVGNFAWEEYSVRNGAARDRNLNRKVESKGTKAAGETWTLTLQITLT